jgi:cell division GTPase FtsZ
MNEDNEHFEVNSDKQFGGSGFEGCVFSNSPISQIPVAEKKSNTLKDVIDSIKSYRIFSVELWHTDLKSGQLMLVDMNVKNGLTLEEAQKEQEVLSKKYDQTYNVTIKIRVP